MVALGRDFLDDEAPQDRLLVTTRQRRHSRWPQWMHEAETVREERQREFEDRCEEWEADDMRPNYAPTGLDAA